MILGQNQPFASPEEALRYRALYHTMEVGEAFLEHFGVLGMRWGVRKERESFSDYGSAYSPAEGQGHGSKLFELSKSDTLVVDHSKGYADVRPKAGFRSELVKTRHDEMTSALEEMRQLYPAINNLKIEVVPMSHVPGLKPFIWGKVPAAASHNKDGEARLMYNDKHKKVTRSNLRNYEHMQPGAATIPGFIGRHEMGHVLAMSGNLMPQSWDATHGTYADGAAYREETNRRHKAAMDKHGITFDEVTKLSRYAASEPVEAFAELTGHYHTPQFREKMSPELQAKAKALFDDVGGNK